jgi:N-carbamoylputrescine amidase
MSLAKTEGEGTIEEIKQAMLEKHLPYIDEAGEKGVQILCFQEIFNTPYFCPGQDSKWYESAETVPGPTTDLMSEYARKYQMVIIVPVYEKDGAGILYNTAAVIDADGNISGNIAKITFRKRVDSGKNIFQTRKYGLSCFPDKIC